MVGLDWVGHPDGAQLYYDSMADRFASWGVDYIKFDGIEDYSTPDLDGMAEAIAQSSNPRCCSTPPRATTRPRSLPRSQRDATQFEYSPDIENSGGAAAYTHYPNVTIRFNSIPTWQQWVGPGNWQDLDSVEIGNGSSPGIGGRMDGLTVDGRKTMLSLWSLADSPLIIGPDLTNLDPVDQGLLTNPDMLAVDQDGVSATRIAGGPYSAASSTYQVFAKQEPGGDGLVGLFNTTPSQPESVSTTASAIGLPASSGGYLLKDVWTHQTTETAGAIAAAVPSQGVAFYRVTPTGNAAQAPPATELTMSGPTTFAPGQKANVTETFLNTGVQSATGVQLSLAAPAGWAVTPASSPSFTSVATGQSISATFSVTAPSTTAASAPLTGTASYGYEGGTPQTATATQTAKVVPSVKVNEVRLGVTGATTNQFIELYNAGSTPVDLRANGGLPVRHGAGGHDARHGPGRHDAGARRLLRPRPQPRLHGHAGPRVHHQPVDQRRRRRPADSTGTLLFDSVGWGTANNALVENCPAPAPPTIAAPGASIVRRPNGADTDSNCSDFAVTTVPSPGALNVVGVSGSGGPEAPCRPRWRSRSARRRASARSRPASPRTTPRRPRRTWSRRRATPR